MPRRRSASELTPATPEDAAPIRSRIRSATVFASGPVFPIGPTQVGTPVLAFAPGNQLARAAPQFVVHRKQRLTEADATGIVVVDEDARLVRQRHRLAGPREIRVVGFVSASDRDADVLPIAHQQQLRDLPHRERQAHHAVTPVVGRKRQRSDDRRGDGQPVRGRMHLLLGKIELT